MPGHEQELQSWRHMSGPHSAWLPRGAAPVTTRCVLATDSDLATDRSLVPAPHVGKLSLDRSHAPSKLFFQACDGANIPGHVPSPSVPLCSAPQEQPAWPQETGNPCPAAPCPGAWLPRSPEEPDGAVRRLLTPEAPTEGAPLSYCQGSMGMGQWGTGSSSSYIWPGWLS